MGRCRGKGRREAAAHPRGGCTEMRGTERERERPLRYGDILRETRVLPSQSEDRGEREMKNKKRCSQGTFEYSDRRRKRDFCDAVRVNALSKT